MNTLTMLAVIVITATNSITAADENNKLAPFTRKPIKSSFLKYLCSCGRRGISEAETSSNHHSSSSISQRNSSPRNSTHPSQSTSQESSSSSQSTHLQQQMPFKPQPSKKHSSKEGFTKITPKVIAASREPITRPKNP